MDEVPRVSLADLNAVSPEEFCDALAGIWEHSPWIVEAVAPQRPFASGEQLAAAMAVVVGNAPAERQLALLRAHPDLAGKLALAGELTVESTNEQASAGLDQLTAEELAQFRKWNADYRARFGFPFIICVRENTKMTIRQAFERRLVNAPEEELRAALAEVQKIAYYRLRDRVRT